MFYVFFFVLSSNVQYKKKTWANWSGGSPEEIWWLWCAIRMDLPIQAVFFHPGLIGSTSSWLGSWLHTEESDEGLSGGHGPEEFGNHHPGNICSAWHLPGNFGIMPSRCCSSFHLHGSHQWSSFNRITCHYVTMSLCSPSLKENSESRPNTIELLPTVRFSQLWGGLHCKGAWRVENHGHGPWVKFMTYSNPMQSRIIDRNPPLVSVNSVGFDVCIFWRV